MTMAEYTEYRTISQYFAIFELQSEYSPLMRELCLKWIDQERGSGEVGKYRAMNLSITVSNATLTINEFRTHDLQKDYS